MYIVFFFCQYRLSFYEQLQVLGEYRCNIANIPMIKRMCLFTLKNVNLERCVPSVRQYVLN